MTEHTFRHVVVAASKELGRRAAKKSGGSFPTSAFRHVVATASKELGKRAARSSTFNSTVKSASRELGKRVTARNLRRRRKSLVNENKKTLLGA